MGSNNVKLSLSNVASSRDIQECVQVSTPAPRVSSCSFADTKSVFRCIRHWHLKSFQVDILMHVIMCFGKSVLRFTYTLCVCVCVCVCVCMCVCVCVYVCVCVCVLAF